MEQKHDLCLVVVTSASKTAYACLGIAQIG
jgi:hypothetical protein